MNLPLRVMIGLENSANKALRMAMAPTLTRLSADVQSAINCKNTDAALDLLVKFDLSPALSKVLPALEELALSTAIFGASQSRDARDTMFVHGRNTPLVFKAAGQMVKIAADLGARNVMKRGTQVVLAKSDAERHDAIFSTFGRFCCPPPLDGRPHTFHHLTKAAPRGKTIRVSADTDDISDFLNEATLGNGRLVADVAANLTTTRLAAFGYLSQAEADGKNTYEITAVLDESTCPVCTYMHGKQLDIKSALKQTMDALDADDPADLETISPWPGQTREDIKDFLQMDPEELQAQGYMVPPFHPACYAEGTQVYTRRGFIDFRELDIETDEFLSLDPETRQMEWVKAHSNVSYDFEGDLIDFTHGWGQSAMLVTPDHSMFYDRRVDAGKAGRAFSLKFGTVDDFSKSSENWLYKTSAHVGVRQEKIRIGTRGYRTEAFLKFLGYYLSEGYVDREGEPVIAQQKHFQLMLDDLSEIGAMSVMQHKITVVSKRLGEWCRQFGKSHEKFVPDFVKDLPPDQIMIFLDAFALGDGSRRNGRHRLGFQSSEELTFSTSSVRLRDDLVELLLRCGYGASYRLQNEKGTVTQHKNGSYACNYDQWVVYRLSSVRRKAKGSPSPYKGKVYDVSLVKNHTLLISWQGNVTWGSNCRCVLVDLGASEATIKPQPEKGAENLTNGPGWFETLLQGLLNSGAKGSGGDADFNDEL